MDLMELALNVDMPSWATHVAVRKDGSNAEPAAWLDTVNDYLDEDPSQLSSHCWAGSYKHCYWTFISRADIKKIKE